MAGEQLVVLWLSILSIFTVVPLFLSGYDSVAGTWLQWDTRAQFTTTLAPSSPPAAAPDDENNEEEVIDYGQAPRTYMGEYNKVLANETYFTYSPYGTLGDQLHELETACRIANALDRILLVPMLGAKTLRFGDYEKLPRTALFPMDRMIDFPHFELQCRAVPLNDTLIHFITATKLVDNVQVFLHRGPSPTFTLHDLQQAITDHPTTPTPTNVFFFRGHGMDKREMWFNDTELFPQVRFSGHLRARAVTIAQDVLPRPFNAMHIRLGGYYAKWPPNLPARQTAMFTRLKQSVKNTSLPVFISTDRPHDTSFGLVENRLDVYYTTNLGADEFGRLFPVIKFRLDMQAVIDVLMCALAQDFAPMETSMISQYVEEIRSNRENLFPESL